MIVQRGHVSSREYVNPDPFASDFDQKCFTLFWELHDERRPFLTRRLIERFMDISANADKEINELLTNLDLNHETTGRAPKGI